MLLNFIYLSIIGIISGIIGGLTGTSGSIIIPPALLITNISPNYKTAIGTTLLAIVPPISIGAAYSYWKAGYVQVNYSIILFLCYFIAATFTAFYTVNYISEQKLYLFYSLFLAFISIYFFYKYFNFHK